MKTPLPDVSSSRGAPMGRADNITEPDGNIKFHLYKMMMIDGDYDEGGAYWGAGNLQIGHMYRAYGDGTKEVQEMFFRARSMEEAKNKVKEVFKNATFLHPEEEEEQKWYTSSSGQVEISMPLEQAQGASHSGDCEADVNSLLELPEIKAQLSRISDADLKETLKEYGAWDEEELKDRKANEQRIIWLAAGDIAEQDDEETA